MKKLILITLLFCCAFTIKGQNLVLNGSFEQNNVTGVDCETEISNSIYSNLMMYSTAFSVYGNLDNGILFENCNHYNQFFDSLAQQGQYSTWLYSADTIINGFHYQQFTALSLELSQQLQVGNYYKLSFHQKTSPFPSYYNYSPGGTIIGISSSDTNFGVVIDTTIFPVEGWTEVEIIFQATIPAQHLTIKSYLELGLHASLVDNFVLTLDSMPPNAINEQYGKKKLLKIVDILGRESKSKKGLLFYIYSDGTVEKRIIIE
jgi:hypothetical protein